LDVVVLEVGLGGRLDAVNIMDPDGAFITTIAIEHTEWLGESREEIALEKGGILRSGRPAVIGDRDPPHTLLDHAQKLGARTLRFDHDYGYRLCGAGWEWWSREGGLDNLPLPPLPGEFQLQNAAGVLALLHALQDQLPVTPQGIREGLRGVRLLGRFQVVENGRPIIIDVAHNPQAARSLCENLLKQPNRGRTLALFSVLGGKNIREIAAELKDQIHHWYLSPLDDSRAATIDEVLNGIQRAGVESSKITVMESVAAALTRAEAEAEAGDRIVAFGSFIMAAEVLAKISTD
jgi:dihydrofolate synthase/folylpolyglutamate synthase